MARHEAVAADEGACMTVLELSLREARRLMIGAQRLSGPTPRRPTKSMMLEMIRHLGAVQIDSISVVARSHHIVLWSRLGNHPQEWLDELLCQDRAIFEYWAHAAAYVPIEYFPYFRRSMLKYANPDGNGWNRRGREWVQENQELLDHVVGHIRLNGPVSSKSFDPPEGAERAAPWAWYGNKPTNLALDVLWRMGTLMIDRREKFQRWYDLTERVLPTWDDAHVPSLEEEQHALGEAALRAMGVVFPRWLPDYFRTDWAVRTTSGTATKRILGHLVESGTAVPARVRGIEGDAVVSAELLERRIPPGRTTLLSPFDSLIWDRRRTMEMFGFPLLLEAYTPAPKRRYGYFSLPILYRDQLIGRLDPKADRTGRVLHVKALHLEPWFVLKADDRFYSALAETLTDFAAFNDCDAIEIGISDPPEAASQLRGALSEV
jgi:uncharacterized protein